MAKKPNRASRAPRGKSKRKWVIFGLLIVGLLLGGGAFLFFKATDEVETAAIDPGDGLDAAEARRKLRLFEQAAKRNARGYIRLPEPEINARLGELFKPSTNYTDSVSHVRTAVNLETNSITVFSWVRKNLPLKPVTVGWQRTFALSHAGGKPQFRLTSMKVGSLVIPPRFWATVTGALGSIDGEYTRQIAALQPMRSLELLPIASGRGMEMRLYNYDPQAASVSPQQKQGAALMRTAGR